MSFLTGTKKGGRPSSHGVSMTLDQWEWVKGTLSKRVLLIDKVKGQPKLKALLQSLDDKILQAVETVPGTFSVSLNRQELRVLGDIVQKTVKALKEKVLPAYERGVRESPDIYSKRAEEAKQTHIKLKALSKKVEAVYDAGSHRRNSDF